MRLLNANTVLTPCAEAVTLYCPWIAFAVAVIEATPFVSVTAVGLDSIALAPVAGAENEMVTPLCGMPFIS